MEFITIELRPRIQSCNIFLYLKEPTEIDLVQVSLYTNSIKVQIAENLHVIELSTINIITTSISNLNVSAKWIVFRVQTAPSNASTGTFATEVVNNLDAIENNCAESSEIIILPPKDSPLSLLCYCCDNLISEPNIVFQRIMPLPSTDYEPYEWFCCFHDSFDYKTLLRPQAQDFFYDSHFSILNKSVFGSDIKIYRDDVLCNKCDTVLGTVEDEYALKIWNHSLKYQLQSTPDFNIESTSPLDDFKLALRKCAGKDAIKDILFVAIEEGVHYYLSVKTIEKKLNLLIESAISPAGNVNTIGKTVLKVLYHCPNTTAPDLKNFTNAHVCRLGFCCLMVGLEYLMETTRRIPPNYSRINDDHVGYIM